MSCLSSSDPSSFSNPEDVKITHADIDWKVDFSSHIISGKATLTLEILKAGTDQVVLDTSGLGIKSVLCGETGQPLQYDLGEEVKSFGSRLSVTLPQDGGKHRKISIKYETSPQSSGLQWLSPSHTSSKTHPFVFSQCQPIHARSLIPCQDTPGVKMTYSAKVGVPSDLVVLMSALRDGQKTSSEGVIYEFHQPVPIPSYLIAIGVGNVVSRQVGPRSHVWGEPDVVDRAAYEFAEIEQMLSHAETLCGEYVWGVYDLLILPPSFPYGGMENPCLTFVTPTLLAGDRSLASVIVHEISHSWTGNLVTNCHWEHFWLNEGFTTFVERKIMGRMHGDPTRHFEAFEGWKSLAECIRTRGATDPLTCLVPNLTGVDPDDAFSSVPYEKGHSFLWHLETVVGGPSEFEPFLKAYIDKFRMQSIDSSMFKEFLYEFFGSKASVLDSIDWKGWWHTPGMPPVVLQFDTTLIDACTDLARQWSAWDVSTECPFSSVDLDGLSSMQKVVWLVQMLEDPPYPVPKLQRMEELYRMPGYSNAEIRCCWIRLCIRGRWEDIVPRALAFVNSQGRMKFVRPIYRDLFGWKEVKERAEANFHAQKEFMMYVSVQWISKDLAAVAAKEV